MLYSPYPIPTIHSHLSYSGMQVFRPGRPRGQRPPRRRWALREVAYPLYHLYILNKINIKYNVIINYFIVIILIHYSIMSSHNTHSQSFLSSLLINLPPPSFSPVHHPTTVDCGVGSALWLWLCAVALTLGRSSSWWSSEESSEASCEASCEAILLYAMIF